MKAKDEHERVVVASKCFYEKGVVSHSLAIEIWR